MSEVVCQIVDKYATPVAALEDASVEEVVWELNAPGSARVSFPTVSETGQLLLTIETELQIWIDGLLEWWGIPFGVKGNSTTLTVELDGLLQYFAYRFITNTSLLYTSVDQLNIAWGLLSQMMTGPDKDLNIQSAAFSGSGHIRSRNYLRGDHGNSLELLAEFPTLLDGFDYEIQILGDGRRLWKPYYPKKGSFKNNLALEWGKNIEDFDYTEDATKLANLVYETGATEGGVKFENNYRDDASAARYGEFQDIESSGNEKDVDWLLAKAAQTVNRRKDPVKIPEITAVQTPDILLGQLVVGDSVPIYIDHGRVQIPGDEYRISKVAWNSDETMKFTVNPISVMS